MTRLLWALGGWGGQGGRPGCSPSGSAVSGRITLCGENQAQNRCVALCLHVQVLLAWVCALGSAIWGWCLSDHLRCGVMGCECPGDFLEEVLCCLEVGLKVLWEPGGKGQGAVLWGRPATPRPGAVVLVAWPSEVRSLGGHLEEG